MDSQKIEKFLRQEQEHEQQGEFLATARAEMEKKGANERSIRLALTGLFEYMQATATYPEPPRPGSKHTPVAGGYFLNDFPSRPVDWLWQDRIPLAALTLLDGDPKNGQLFYHPFSLPGDEHFLENIITRTEAVLVIIDTLDICQPHQRQRALPRLVDLADRTGCAIVLTRPRTTSRSGQDAPIHSTAPLDLRAFVSSSLLIAPYPGDSEQRFLITARHPLAPQPKTLYYEILGPADGAPIINWLGAEEHPDSRPEEGPSGRLGIIHILTLAALKDASSALSARELSCDDEEYNNVRKLLNRMLHAGQVVSPARGLYTLPDHPCLAQYPVLDTSTAAASPVPNVSSVSSIPTTQATPDTANNQDTNPQTAPVSIVPSVPTTPADPDPADDQDTDSQTPSVSNVPSIPNTTSTPPHPHSPSDPPYHP